MLPDQVDKTRVWERWKAEIKFSIKLLHHYSANIPNAHQLMRQLAKKAA